MDGAAGVLLLRPRTVNYLRSGAAAGSPDDISHFLSAVESQLEDEGADIVASFPDLRAGVRYVLDHWESFDVDPGLYGNLRERYVAVARQLGA